MSLNRINIDKNFIVTSNFLRKNLDYCFVFGDNLFRMGKGGAAALRDEINVYGFVTKKAPNNDDVSFFRVEEYLKVYNDEISKLKLFVAENENIYKYFLISKLGAGLANKYKIWENVILPNIKSDLEKFENKIIYLF